MPEEKKIRKFVKGPEKRTHQINIKSVLSSGEKQGYIPVVFEGTSKELEKRIRNALGLEAD